MRLPIPETPIFLPVLDTSHEQITTLKPALGLEPLSQLSIELLLDLRRTTLLKDLDEDEVMRTFQPEIRILADDLVRFVLGDDLDRTGGEARVSTRVYLGCCMQV